MAASTVEIKKDAVTSLSVPFAINITNAINEKLKHIVDEYKKNNDVNKKLTNQYYAQMELYEKIYEKIKDINREKSHHFEGYYSYAFELENAQKHRIELENRLHCAVKKAGEDTKHYDNLLPGINIQNNGEIIHIQNLLDKNSNDIEKYSTYVYHKKKYNQLLKKHTILKKDATKHKNIAEQIRQHIASSHNNMKRIQKVCVKLLCEEYIKTRNIKHTVDESCIDLKYIQKIYKKCDIHCRWTKFKSLRKYVCEKYPILGKNSDCLEMPKY